MKEDLQGRYVKEYLQTYLVLPYSSGVEDIYKLKMLENNDPPGILDVSLEIEGGEAFCKYAVGGMKAMDLVFRTLPIDLQKLVAILKCFVSAFEQAAELLLDPNDLVLRPEYVFVNISDYKAGFVYLPGYNTDAAKQAESFFEYMLNRVDYDDKKAVALLYDCYILVMKEERGIEALKERIEKDAPAPIRAENTEIAVSENDRVPPLLQPEPSLKNWFKGRFNRKKEQDKKPVVKEEERLFDEDDRETVLLAERKEECNPCLLCVGKDERTVIDKLPFIIGSLSGHTDYTPAGRNVSRLHAEIRQTVKGLALVDLNSTNGTKLNGQNLVPGEEYDLMNNDRIRLADVDLIYREPLAYASC